MIRLKPNVQDLLDMVRKEQARRLNFFEHNGIRYQADPKSVQAMASRCSLASPDDVIVWADADNRLHEMPVVDLFKLASMISERNDKVYASASAMKVKIESGAYVDPTSSENWEIE